MNNTNQLPENGNSSVLADMDIGYDPGSEYGAITCVGMGVYKEAWVCKQRSTNTEVVVKKTSRLESAIICKHALCEIKLLNKLSHPNIIPIIDVVKPHSQRDYDELYTVHEQMDVGLPFTLEFESFSEEQIRYMLCQLLRAVKYIHSCDVIHRNLTSDNILIDFNQNLKVNGLGLACSSNNPSFLTRYFGPRGYHAPEVLLSYEASSKAMDIWSVGCIFAEMLNNEQLFPYCGYRKHLLYIFELLGTPKPEDYLCIKNKDMEDFIRRLPTIDNGCMKNRFSTANPLALDLLERMLVFDPKKRITAEEALKHPFLAQFHNIDDEPCGKPLDPEFFKFNSRDKGLGSNELKDLIWQEIQNNSKEHTQLSNTKHEIKGSADGYF